MRARFFVQRAAERIIFMAVHGYDPMKLLAYTKRFMRSNYLPREKWRRVNGKITARTHALACTVKFQRDRARQKAVEAEAVAGLAAPGKAQRPAAAAAPPRRSATAADRFIAAALGVQQRWRAARGPDVVLDA